MDSKVRNGFLRLSYNRYDNGSLLHSSNLNLYKDIKGVYRILISNYWDDYINGTLKYLYSDDYGWMYDDAPVPLIRLDTIDVLMTMDHSKYLKIKETQSKLFNDINEEVGSNFGEAKKEFIEFALDKFKDVDPDVDLNRMDSVVCYELYRKEGLYIVLVIGYFIDAEYYQKNGYIYGRNGWKYNSDMENIIENKDKLEMVIRFGYSDYIKVMDQQNKLMKDINEGVDNIDEIKKGYYLIAYNIYKKIYDLDLKSHMRGERVLLIKQKGSYHIILLTLGRTSFKILHSYTDGGWVKRDDYVMVSDFTIISDFGKDEYERVDKQQNRLMNDINESIMNFSEYKRRNNG